MLAEYANYALLGKHEPPDCYNKATQLLIRTSRPRLQLEFSELRVEQFRFSSVALLESKCAVKTGHTGSKMLARKAEGSGFSNFSCT